MQEAKELGSGKDPNVFYVEALALQGGGMIEEATAAAKILLTFANSRAETLYADFQERVAR